MPEALRAADRVVLAAVFSSARLPQEKELSEENVIDDLRQQGVEAWFLPAVDEIVTHLVTHVAEGDVVLVMSNGGFGGLHQKLLDALSGKEIQRKDAETQRKER
jgi:UDP-N-acetylmuramate: L-alanyl-gamma-D-glutamyl-meso-diaminopimelate ligase